MLKVKNKEPLATLIKYVLIANFLLATAANAGVDSNPINRPEDGEIPFQIRSRTVLLYGNGIQCSGVITGPHTILTAQHCCEDWTKELPRAVFISDPNGSIRAYDAQRAATSVKAIGDHDVCKVTVDSIPKGYSPVKILSDDAKLSRGSTVVIAGFGITAPNDQSDTKLNYGFTKLLSKFESNAMLNIFTNEEDHFAMDQMFGTGHVFTRKFSRKYSATCPGDSGGPVYFIEEDGVKLLGIISSGTPCDAEYFLANFATDVRKLGVEEFKK